MPIKSFEELAPNKNLVPDAELERSNRLRRNLALYNGDFREMGITSSDTTIKPVNVNWFRRSSEFYPEFMLSEKPVLTIDGNASFNLLLDELSTFLWNEIGLALVDLLALGEAVLVSHPNNPTQLMRINPSHWYEVRKPETGELIGDVWYAIRGSFVADDQYVDLYEYRLDGTATRRIHKYDAGNLGPQYGEVIPLPAREGRQVVPIPRDNGIFPGVSRSLFDDMKVSIAELSRTATGVALTLKNNLRPHLVGPDGILKTIDGKSVVDNEGMFLPMQEGDPVPFYLQWDSDMSAVEWTYDTHLENALTHAGLHMILFDPQQLGEVSGRALRRLLLPFLAKLNSIKETLTLSLEDVLSVITLNNYAQGGEFFAWEKEDINIEWRFEQIFDDIMDENEEDQVDLSQEEDEETGDN